jgi:hypothetical protein
MKPTKTLWVLGFVAIVMTYQLAVFAGSTTKTFGTVHPDACGVNCYTNQTCSFLEVGCTQCNGAGGSGNPGTCGG